MKKNYCFLVILCLLAFQNSSWAQMISTVAGTGQLYTIPDGTVAVEAQLDFVNVVAFDSYGNYYFAGTSTHKVYKVDASTGVITTVAGTGTPGFSGDGGQAADAQLDVPTYLAIDASNNLYIADLNNQRIRKVEASTGMITTVAGTGTIGYSGDGEQATAAQLSHPRSIAVDASGNLYIADYYNDRIRRVDASTGVITTVAGTGTAGYSGDGEQATAAQLSHPQSIAVDASGNLYIVDYNNHRIRKVDASTGVIMTVAGTGTRGFSGDDGQATDAQLYQPTGIAVDSYGNLYIASYFNHRVRKVEASTGVISTVAGTGTSGYSGDDGQATAAQLFYPRGVAVDSSDNLYINDYYNHCIRKVDISTGLISTIAGPGTAGYNGDGVQATDAQLNEPRSIAVDASGNLYVNDYNNHRIRKVEASSGIITTVAGTGTAGYSGDGEPAHNGQLNKPKGIILDAWGNLYIADGSNHRIRKIDASTGVITTVAGTGTAGYSGDSGQATAAQLNFPYDVAVDDSGNLFIADLLNHCIRKVEASTGIITTVAGTGIDGYDGDGGPATAAHLDRPSSLALDDSDNLYIADFTNNRIRKVEASTGIITTVAGTGTAGYSGDGGPATAAHLYRPIGLALDDSGNLYIADLFNHSIRKIEASTGLIITVAGTGAEGSSGDGGQAQCANLDNAVDVTTDASGNLYIADRDNHRIRKVTFDDTYFTLQCPDNLEFTEGESPSLALGSMVDDCNGSPQIDYTLSGATTASGDGEVTADMLNPGLTTVTYTVKYSGGHQINCSFEVKMNEKIVILNSEATVDNELMIYPNPVTEGVVTLESLKGYNEIHIVDLFGKQVYLKKGINQQKIDLQVEALSSGIYVVHLIGRTGKKSMKLYVEN